jgi:hypothetical protein
MSDDSMRDMVEGLAELAEAMKPILELAEGQRKMMEAQGWSPTAAEAYALELLLGLTRHALSGGKK